MQYRNEFEKEVVEGLKMPQKKIASKFFYDEAGDKIFQEIMKLEEYYLPNCETEILKTKTNQIAGLFQHNKFDVMELGAGDGTKTVHFLKYLVNLGKQITYYPMDISPDVLKTNSKNISAHIPSLKIVETPGDYFETMHQLKRKTPKMILFMGSNIGNYEPNDAINFLKMIRANMLKDDILLIGVDLKKDPETILAAYNDPKGVTKRFNLNLLIRLNRELSANFDINQFEHAPRYDSKNGITYSYLRSLQNQEIKIGNNTIHFDKHELLHTEISKKYGLDELEELKKETGFRTVNHFLDSKSYFSVSVFKK